MQRRIAPFCPLGLGEFRIAVSSPPLRVASAHDLALGVTVRISQHQRLPILRSNESRWPALRHSWPITIPSLMHALVAESSTPAAPAARAASRRCQGSSSPMRSRAARLTTHRYEQIYAEVGIDRLQTADLHEVPHFASSRRRAFRHDLHASLDERRDFSIPLHLAAATFARIIEVLEEEREFQRALLPILP